MSDVIGLKKAKQSLTEIVVFPSLYGSPFSLRILVLCTPFTIWGAHC